MRGAPRTLRGAQRTGRGRSEEVQRTLGGAQRTLRSAHWTLRSIQRTLRGVHRTLRGRPGDAQRPLRGRSEALRVKTFEVPTNPGFQRNSKLHLKYGLSILFCGGRKYGFSILLI